MCWIIFLSVFMMLCVPSYNSDVDKTEDGAIVFKVHECDTDADCFVGYFCYEATSSSAGRICTACQDCSHKYFRESRKSCATSFYECGQCLPGYKELKLTNGDPKAKCEWITESAASREVPTDKFTNSGHKSNRHSIKIAVSIIGCIICISALVALGFYHRNKHHHQHVGDNNNHETPPQLLTGGRNDPA